MAKKHNKPDEKNDVQNSSLATLSGGYVGGAFPIRTDGIEARSIISQVDQEWITNNRLLVSRLWQKDWVCNKIVELPIQDAFKELPKFVTDLATEEQIEQVQRKFQQDVLPALLNFYYLARCYGSAALIIETGNQSPESSKAKLKSKEFVNNPNISYIPVSFWHLLGNQNWQNGSYMGFMPENYKGMNEEVRYKLHSTPIHSSRVITLSRNKPDYEVSRFLWHKGGTSIFESIFTALDKKAITEALAVELMTEAKIDVLSIKGLTGMQSSPNYASSLQNTIGSKMQGKNFNSTLILDGTTTEYEQKQINLSGVTPLLDSFQTRLFQAASIPPKRIAGLSTAGLSDTDKTTEEYYNRDLKIIQSWGYNSYLKLVKYTFLNIHGFAPEDLSLEFPPLDTPSAEVQQTLKGQKMDNINKLTSMLDMPPEKIIDLINAEGIFSTPLENKKVKNKLANF